ncbi:MAG TPA: CopD family protein [Polyangiaceae bacterium]|nr:CopD family protein [Polyangiaceae bacterium]
MDIAGIVTSLHVAANVVWIGSILAVGRIIEVNEGDAKIRGALALKVYKGLAVPAFGVSFVAGVVRLLLNPDYYFVQTHFMHAKLLFALVVIGLHHVMGARAKKVANGDGAAAAAVPALTLGILGAAVLVVFLAVMKPF